MARSGLDERTLVQRHWPVVEEASDLEAHRRDDVAYGLDRVLDGPAARLG